MLQLIFWVRVVDFLPETLCISLYCSKRVLHDVRTLTTKVHFIFAVLDTSITISVPFSHLVLPAPWGEACVFALQPKPKNPGRSYWFNFGSSVVDSMYLVVDYDMNTLAIAKADYSGREADIVPIVHR